MVVVDVNGNKSMVNSVIFGGETANTNSDLPTTAAKKKTGSERPGFSAPDEAAGPGGRTGAMGIFLGSAELHGKKL